MDYLTAIQKPNIQQLDKPFTIPKADLLFGPTLFSIILRILELQSLQCHEGEVSVLESKLDEIMKEKSDLQNVVDKLLEDMKGEKDKLTAGIQKTV